MTAIENRYHEYIQVSRGEIKRFFLSYVIFVSAMYDQYCNFNLNIQARKTIFLLEKY